MTTLTNINSQTITGTKEAGATITVSINTTAVAGPVNATDTTWSCTITGLAEGGNTITVTAMDQATNTTVAPPVTITVDTTPPVVGITLPVAGS